jgi:hypothetical protein
MATELEVVYLSPLEAHDRNSSVNLRRKILI